jgi:uncharacterized protein YjbI with pentapeptide repeats
MPNEELTELLKKGSAVWNDWRQQNLMTRPDLSGADLKSLDLRRAVLDGADLSDADLSGSDLSEAKLVYANLCGAVLAGDTEPDREGAVNLNRADLTRAAGCISSAPAGPVM